MKTHYKVTVIKPSERDIEGITIPLCNKDGGDLILSDNINDITCSKCCKILDKVKLHRHRKYDIVKKGKFLSRVERDDTKRYWRIENDI